MPPFPIGPKRNGEHIRRAADSGKGPPQVCKTPVALSAKPPHTGTKPQVNACVRMW